MASLTQDLPKGASTPRKPFRPGRLGIYLMLIFFVIIYLVPVYLVLTTSLKTASDVNLQRIWDLPSTPTLESFSSAFTALRGSLFNSIVLTVPATALSAIIGSLNGYVLSKWRFPGANIIFPLMLFGMFIPYQSVLIPLFQLLSSVKLTINVDGQERVISLVGNIIGLILTHVVYGLPITTLIFRNYYTEVPNEMLEAGQMDGAGFFKLYTEILFPLSLPGFVVVIIWQFTQIWNEYLFGVTLTDPTSQPITVALSQLSGGNAIDFSLQMAGSFLTALPTLLVYILLGRYFIRGLLAGSVKG
jgi:glucose/mannose transport system permease protein